MTIFKVLNVVLGDSQVNDNRIGIIKHICGGWNVEINIFDSIKDHSHNVYIWGFPYINSHILLNGVWNKNNLNQISGYYLAINISANSIEIVNDILGGYRVYYSVLDNTIIVSDKYEYIVERVKEKRKIEVDNEQLSFWMKHRYTLDEGTLFQKIKKLSPASKYTIDNGGLRHDTYFLNVPRNSNYRQLLHKNYTIIAENLKQVHKEYPDLTYILFYSGGVDSTFLLFVCKELGIPIKCVLIRYLPNWSVNQSDIERAKENLDRIGQEYTIVDVDLSVAKKEYEEIAVRELLFDRHLAVHFYQTFKVIADLFGKDIVVINGQSADSILSFGPSEFTKGNLIKRAILAFSNGPIGWVGKQISKRTNVRFVMPFGKKDSSISIMDDTNYIFAIDKKCEYLSLLSREYDSIIDQGITEFESVRMFSKIIGFLQGSDNQVVIKSALYNGIKKVVLPFTSPTFIYNVIKHKNNIYEIIKPKYFVRQLLKKRYHYECTRSRKLVIIDSDFDMLKFEKKMTDSYIERFKSFTK